MNKNLLIQASLLKDIDLYFNHNGIEGILDHSREISDILANTNNDNKNSNSLCNVIKIASIIASDASMKDAENCNINNENLKSIFNILNNNQGNMYHSPTLISDGINYPIENTDNIDSDFISKVYDNVNNVLQDASSSMDFTNYLLCNLEENFSYVRCLGNDYMSDVSMYDHVKLTAAVASCIYDYQLANDDDLNIDIVNGNEQVYSDNMFLLYSMDISGIQDFIYTIISENALKSLRSRSFYLDIMMEHIVNVLLSKLELSKANVIYSGGGHCYLLLSNTQQTKDVLHDFNNDLNSWFMKTFNIALYVAHGYAECSANTLWNIPNGSYSELFRKVSNSISDQKTSRYSAKEISELNNKNYEDYSRECSICHRMDNLDDNNKCVVCSAIEDFSRFILDSNYFIVGKSDDDKLLKLPFGYSLVALTDEEFKNQVNHDDVWIYSKNKFTINKNGVYTNLFYIADYSPDQSFRDLADNTIGIDRIGVLRADVDNLGQAFVSGFNNESNKNRYVNLMRTASLSRKLTLFFKYYLNDILKNKTFSLINSQSINHATVCYSGGDDLFIVGAWNNVIEFAVDIRSAFKKFTQNTLSLSCGIGVFDDKYPIHAIANEVASMEEKSKANAGKNSITLFENYTYKWDDFVNIVANDKFKVISDFFNTTNERGMSFLYNLLSLINNQDDKINFARFIYVLARLEPKAKPDSKQMVSYNYFKSKIINWVQNKDDIDELTTAMIIYAYLKRGKEN